MKENNKKNKNEFSLFYKNKKINKDENLKTIRALYTRFLKFLIDEFKPDDAFIDDLKESFNAKSNHPIVKANSLEHLEYQKKINDRSNRINNYMFPIYKEYILYVHYSEKETFLAYDKCINFLLEKKLINENDFEIKKETINETANEDADEMAKAKLDEAKNMKLIEEAKVKSSKNNSKENTVDIINILEDDDMSHDNSENKKIEVNDNVKKEDNTIKRDSNIPFNSITFGAPGTGKSHEIKNMLNQKEVNQKDFVFRTTFYEDYSYFDFVGQFKPTMMYNANSQSMYRRTPQAINNVQGENYGSPTVIYEFVSGILIDAYVKAINNPDDKVYLIIEEINRGNAPAIFGDFFQSLDRDQNGLSKYPIKVNEELKIHIRNKTNNSDFDEFVFPSNLYLLGTMNTSDQSLFKMDNAFKRRWAMKYSPICFKDKKFDNIKIENTSILWKDFVNKSNELILNLLNSEDKMIGQYFCYIDHSNGVPTVPYSEFSDKLLHYLFFDVFRFNRTEVFNTESFSELYNKNAEEILLLIEDAINND